VNPFREEEIGFLRLIARVVAFALDDGLNLRRAKSAQACGPDFESNPPARMPFGSAR
jgi:hypothetical protein